MKIIDDCIKENAGFLPSLKTLVKEAVEGGESEDVIVFIFVDANGVVDRIVTGTDHAIWGSQKDLITSYGYSIKDILNLEG